MSRLTSDDAKRLYNLLGIKDQGYYSLGVRYVAKHLDIDLDLLRSLGDRFSRPSVKFYTLYHDYINVFKYNRVTYIGLESRRLDYDIDELLGLNPIVKAIARGEYD
jgi:hypothetical protein